MVATTISISHFGFIGSRVRGLIMVMRVFLGRSLGKLASYQSAVGLGTRGGETISDQKEQ